MTHAISDEYAAAWIETRGQVQTNVGGVGRSRPQVRITAVDPAVPEALCEFYGRRQARHVHAPNGPAPNKPRH
jgi:hypothetical protein